MSAKSKRAWIVTAWLLLGLGLLYAILQLASTRMLRNAYLALEKDGRPMRAGQIIPPLIPDSDNGALLYQSAVSLLKKEQVGSSNLFTRLNDLSASFLKEPLGAPEREELDRLLASPAVAESIRLVTEGTGRPGCRYPLDYTQGANMLLPHLSELRALSRILCVQARMQAAAGQASNAWETVILSLHFADALEKEPTLISLLVRLAQRRLSMDAIHELARVALPSDSQSAAIQSLLEPADYARTFAFAMDGERLLFGEWGFNLPRGELVKLLTISGFEEKPDWGLRLGALILRLPPVMNRDHAAYLTLMHRYAQTAGNPYSKGDVPEMDKLIEQTPRYCVLTRLLSPALGQVKLRILGAAAEARVTQAGLTVLGYRKTAGAFPENLALCGAASFTDPFTGKPLLYKTTATGFTLYSTGPDQKDDGGSDKKGPDEKPLDLVWNFAL